jgi:outer membrane protein TolC
VARASLNDALGLPLGSEHNLSTNLTPVLPPAENLTALESQAISGRPELTQAKLAHDIASTQLADARSRYLPEVAVRGAFEANRQTFLTRGGANWLLSVGLRWNLFNGGADKARIAEAQSGLRRAEALAKSADSSVRLELRRAHAQLHAAQERIALAQSALAEAEESLRISKNRYDAGLATVTDLLRTESALLETRTRHLAAIHQQRIAATQLALAASTLSPDSELLQ